MTTKEIRLAEIAPSPTNPRKTFDPEKLQELARSIAEKGLIQPILVRPHQNGGGVKYEIVAGERRFRACGLANIETIACTVRELDDVQVLELQTIENLQRDDLHPLEEAEGYAALMKQGGYDVAGIAARIGKSGKYVYDRIKLLELIPLAQKIFLAGEITAGHAILLARLSPADQERTIGMEDGDTSYFLGGGLFQHENVDDDPGLELDDPRKPASVRELQTWIDKNVRFKAAEVDLPNLFPETAAALTAAAEEKLKVVHITHDHHLVQDAKEEGERTYTRPSWKRADGQVDDEDYLEKGKPSKTCEHSVLGVIVAGRGRSQAFRVCIAKKKCAVHWKEEQEAVNERGAPNGAGSKAGQSSAREKEEARRKRQQDEQRRAEAERARWQKAGPKLQQALAEKLKTAPASQLMDVIIGKVKGYGQPATSKHMTRGKTIEDAVRFAAFLVLAPELSGYWAHEHAPKVLKAYGLDAKKIVDQVAPKEKPKKEEPAKKERKAAGSSAVERIKKTATKAATKKKAGARA